MSDRIDYGIDAPNLVRGFVLGGLAAMVLTAALLLAGGMATSWGVAITTVLAIAALYLLGMGGLMVVWSRVIKLLEREALLDRIDWRGDEQVLDIGCGRGLMLIGAARRLSGGHAVGIDIWQATDQSSNSAAATLENARKAGVSGRVSVETADMRSLPFSDATFDVIVSHWAVHNLEEAADRDTALAEMARTLRPGGVVILADIAHHDAYARALTAHGLVDQRRFGSRSRDLVLRTLSFGSFRPGAIIARRG